MALEYDVVVIGGGTIGLSAAYHASCRKTTSGNNYSVALVDQYDVDNDQNSSKGYERMYRILYAPENRARLVESAYAMWHEMESYTGTEILAERPMLFFGYPDASTFEGSLQAIADTMDTLGIPYNYLDSPAAIASEFNMFDPNGMPSTYVGLQQNMGATILAQPSFTAFEGLAGDNGVSFFTNSKATSISLLGANGPPYLVTLADGTQIQAQYLIMALGIWLDSVLASFNLKASSTWSIWTMTLGYYNTTPTYRDTLPVWYEFGNADNGLFYGFQPTGQGPDDVIANYPYSVKISADFTNNITTNVTNALNTPPDANILSDITDRLNTLFVPETFSSTTALSDSTAACNYSMNGDGDMVIGKIPKNPGSTSYWANASLFCMASGRGFKFTPLWGRVLVDLAIDGETSYQNDIEPFSPSRSGVFEST